MACSGPAIGGVCLWATSCKINCHRELVVGSNRRGSLRGIWDPMKRMPSKWKKRRLELRAFAVVVRGIVVHRKPMIAVNKVRTEGLALRDHPAVRGDL